MGTQFTPPLPQLLPTDNGVPRADVSSFHADYDTFIFDADGVLWLGKQPIAGASELIAQLIDTGKKVLICTNNSTHSLAFYADKCRRFGMRVNAENIISAAIVCAHELRKMRAARPEIASLPIYLIGTAELRDVLQAEVGVECFGPGPDSIESYTDKTFLMDIDVSRRVAAVVTSFDSHISYPKIMRAVNYLRDPNVAFIATNEDLTFPGNRPDVVVPGSGTVSTVIRAISGRTPIVMGKPDSAAFNYMRDRYNIDPTRTVMIGDRCDTDIAFGRRNGLATLLVLSGVNSLADVANYRAAGTIDCVPAMYAESVRQLLKTGTERVPQSLSPSMDVADIEINHTTVNVTATTQPVVQPTDDERQLSDDSTPPFFVGRAASNTEAHSFEAHSFEFGGQLGVMTQPVVQPTDDERQLSDDSTPPFFVGRAASNTAPSEAHSFEFGGQLGVMIAAPIPRPAPPASPIAFDGRPGVTAGQIAAPIPMLAPPAAPIAFEGRPGVTAGQIAAPIPMPAPPASPIAFDGRPGVTAGQIAAPIPMPAPPAVPIAFDGQPGVTAGQIAAPIPIPAPAPIAGPIVAATARRRANWQMIQTRDEQIDRLSRDNDELRLDNDELRRANRRLRMQNVGLRRRIDRLADVVAQLQEQMDVLRQQQNH